MHAIKARAILFITFFLTGSLISKAQLIPTIQSGPYFQEIKTEISLPTQAGKNVIKLFKTQNTLIAVTSNGVFKYNEGKWSGKAFGSDWQTATFDSKGEIWLASAQFIQKNGDAKQINLPDFAQKDTIICLMWENDKTLQVGTTIGLLTYDGEWKVVSFAKGKRVNSLTKDQKGELWIATADGLLRRGSGKWVNLDDNLMAYGLKRHYFALESHQDKVLFSGLFAVGCIAEDGNNWLLTGADGLPYGPATSICISGENMWLGTARGAIKKDQNWHYYNGKRWLPSNKVKDILPVDEHTTWIATSDGISQIQEVEMTLEQKAVAFEERIKLRHDRHGLVSPSKLKNPGDLSTSRTVNNDNDGLWTSIYLAAECYRYAVTKDPEARNSAMKTYEAMERLETVTGISGLAARSFAAATDSVTQSRSPHSKKWHPSPDGKWQWLDDVSSDETVGHLFSVSLFYDLVADNEMKIRVKGLVERIMNHIIDNNFQIIDLDGKPTKWAIWNPDSLNHNDNWAYERGLNSLQILSFLKTAVYITGNPKFEKAYRTLIEKHGYAENALQAKKYAPFENSHSDDLLAYLPYYCLIRYAKTDQFFPVYTKSLQRSWDVAQQDRIPLWNIIASAGLKKDCDLRYALEELQLIPMDMISWKMENSHRWDLPQNPLLGRFRGIQSVKPIPTPEGGISKWNTNPHQYDTGDNGSTEDDGAYFLLPYWMGRYHGYFVEKY
ncbi:MAG: hypothetical protein JZU47_22040 [Prolixibacteraceae bacterium]|nr:hypothetical protein [Prolixibacteraceae bacterium]